ncbi:MAG: hypothetical protein ACI9JN_002962, partial [Bacteroidia bacterium]
TVIRPHLLQITAEYQYDKTGLNWGFCIKLS